MARQEASGLAPNASFRKAAQSLKTPLHYIPQIKQDVFEDVPDDFSLAQDVYAYYSDRLDKALFKLFNPPPEGMAESTFMTDRNDHSAQIRAMLRKDSSALADLAKSTDQIDRLDAELREIDARLKQFSQSRSAIARGQELHQKRGALIAKHEGFAGQLNELELEINTLQQTITELRGQETNHAAVVEKAEKGRDLTAIASRYREVTSRIRENAAVQLREEISQNVGELWTEIVERQREFTGLEFDSHWGCHLIRRDGEMELWEDVNTSAGQRQVRMLAFYEALRRLAKLVPPLVVDTPLGRLDKEVRANVLDKLYLTGHQSLILSTNSEIDPDSALFDSIRDRLARVYTLHAHGEPDSIEYQVRVSGDYFGRQL